MPDFVFLGFCAKRSFSAPFAGQTREITSVSECLSKRPDEWIKQWDFNHATCWNTEAETWARVPDEFKGAFRLFPYRAMPLHFDKTGIAKPVTLDEPFPKSCRLCRGSQHLSPTTVSVTTSWSEIQRWGFWASAAHRSPATEWRRAYP